MFQKSKIVMLALTLCLLAPKSFANDQGANEEAAISNISDNVVMVVDRFGHEVPFPKLAIVVFPWEMIEGYWETSVGEVTGIFAFRIDYSDPTRKRVKVAYMDRTGGRVLAQGYGYVAEDEKSIRASIEGTGISASMLISAYKVSVLGVQTTELVTSIQSKLSQGRTGATQTQSYVIRKIHN